jgi:hypothetical protein
LLIQKKNIKFGKKKALKLNRLNFEAVNLTDYHASQNRTINDTTIETDSSVRANIICPQNVPIATVEK